jgi:MoaA/NifB/PqqE/SkfB family radical SAM enzyme
MCFHSADYDYMVTEASRIAQKAGIVLHHQPIFSNYSEGAKRPCYKPWTTLNVKRNGDIQICCGGSPISGNMFENDFYSVWNNSEFQSFRSRVNSDDPPDACKKCTRGRENPWKIASHLTYMRHWDSDRINAKLACLDLPLRVNKVCIIEH